MHAGALRALEFDRIVTVVRGFAQTPQGEARLADLQPATDPKTVAAALAATSETVRFLSDYQISLQAPADLEAILAALPAVRRDGVLDRLELRPYTPHTIVDAATLRRALEEIRERGYAIDDEEYDDGVRCVAVPVMGAPNELIGAISISAPANRLTRQRCTELVPLLRRSASELAAAVREKTEPSA